MFKIANIRNLEIRRLYGLRIFFYNSPQNIIIASIIKNMGWQTGGE